MAAISPFVHHVSQFQQLGLINKAVLDATAVDIPLITFAQNNTARKESALRQALVLLVAFVLAPLHARLLVGRFARNLVPQSAELSQTLMRVPFKELINLNRMKASIQNLLGNQTPGLSIDESLRRKLIGAKAGFLATDLAVCGLLLSSIGFIKVAFGKFLTGKDQFSGEMGIVSDKTLDRIYQKAQAKKQPLQLTKHAKELATAILGVGIPAILGFTVFKALMKGDQVGKIGKAIQWVAGHLDYNYPQYKNFKNWPLLSDGGQILLALLLTLGELTSARSPREFKELLIQRNSIDALFFFGTPIMMKLLSGGNYWSVQQAIQHAERTGQSVNLIRKAATRAARAYVGSYLIAAAAVALIVTITNNITRQGIKQEAAKLDRPASVLSAADKRPARAKTMPQPAAPFIPAQPGRVGTMAAYQWQPSTVIPLPANQNVAYARPQYSQVAFG